MPAYLIDGADDIKEEWLKDVKSVGLTAGASAPESLVQGVIARLHEFGAGDPVEVDGIPENMEFALPRELRLEIRS